MFRYVFLVVTLAIASTAFAAPAAATVTGATLKFDQGDAQGKYSAFCPQTLTFSGTISGSPGTQVQYEFYRNGAPSNSILTGTLDGSGHLAVKDSQQFSASTSSFDQIYVLTDNVYSPRVPFTLTCLWPVPKGPKTVQPSPYNVHATNNADECGKTHNGSWACVAIDQGDLLLVWDWTPSNVVDFSHKTIQLRQVDGFRLYRVDGGRHDRLGQQAFPNITAWAVAKPKAGYLGACYAISAYYGALETSPSSPYCVVGNLTRSVTLRTGGRWHWWSLDKHGADGLGASAFALQVLGPTPGCPSMCVGYYHAVGSDGTYRLWDNEYFRMGAWFDVGSLSGKKIERAAVHFHVIGNDFNERANGKDRYCLAEVATGKSDWWNSGTDMANYPAGSFDDALRSVTVSGNDVAVDITPYVQGWVDGSIRNRGIVARGPDEDNDNTRTNEHCSAAFDTDPTLEVRYR